MLAFAYTRLTSPLLASLPDWRQARISLPSSDFFPFFPAYANGLFKFGGLKCLEKLAEKKEPFFLSTSF